MIRLFSSIYIGVIRVHQILLFSSKPICVLQAFINFGLFSSRFIGVVRP